VKAATVLILAFLFPSISAEARPAQTGSLCIGRAEDEGSVNIYPVQISIDQKKPVGFLGGDQSCVRLRPGAHSLELSWHDFDWKRRDHGLSGKVLQRENAAAAVEIGRETLVTICSYRSNDQPRWHSVTGKTKNCSSP
jgi:hypothetical protein